MIAPKLHVGFNTDMQRQHIKNTNMKKHEDWRAGEAKVISSLDFCRMTALFAYYDLKILNSNLQGGV